LANEFGVPVVGDFRLADVAAGGQGAPFAPLYHKALVKSLPFGMLPHEGPVAVVNMGGVGNVTYVDGETVIAFDTGPANGPMDDWVAAWTGRGYDKDGLIAASGKVDEARVRKALADPYFTQPPPKSLDRLDFTQEMVEGLNLQDGAATLTAFSAICVAQARKHFPAEPVAWIVCGGGRHNPTLMQMISAAVPAIVYSAEDMGWRGDHLEAEAFAFLAARSVRGLPLSLPTTTGVPEPMTGGALYEARPLDTSTSQSG
jgi:anhydro-N-acetylmuramic acid kinase